VAFASEEAESLPAESDCPERKSTCSYFAVHRFRVKKEFFSVESVTAVPIFEKRVFIKSKMAEGGIRGE